MLPGSIACTNLIRWLLVAGHLPITTSLSPTGMKEAHTHTNIPLLDIGVRAYMIKQALHVGVSKGQNQHESNSLKVCFKLGKPALSGNYQQNETAIAESDRC